MSDEDVSMSSLDEEGPIVERQHQKRPAKSREKTTKKKKTHDRNSINKDHQVPLRPERQYNENEDSSFGSGSDISTTPKKSGHDNVNKRTKTQTSGEVLQPRRLEPFYPSRNEQLQQRSRQDESSTSRTNSLPGVNIPGPHNPTQNRTIEVSVPSTVEQSTTDAKLEQILGALVQMKGDSVQLNERMAALEDRRRELPQKLQVPRSVVDAVHDGHKQGREMKLKWSFGDGERWLSTVNDSLNEHIKQYVAGRCPTADPTAVVAAMKRFYKSKKEEHSRRRTNKLEAHNQRQKRYQRKKEKVKRRTQGLDQKRSYNPMKKKETRDVLRIEYMSSDENGEDGVLVTRGCIWRSADFNQRLKELDEKYLASSKSQSRRQLASRISGEPSDQPPPAMVQQNHSWIFV